MLSNRVTSNIERDPRMHAAGVACLLLAACLEVLPVQVRLVRQVFLRPRGLRMLYLLLTVARTESLRGRGERVSAGLAARRAEAGRVVVGLRLAEVRVHRREVLRRVRRLRETVVLVPEARRRLLHAQLRLVVARLRIRMGHVHVAVLEGALRQLGVEMALALVVHIVLERWQLGVEACVLRAGVLGEVRGRAVWRLTGVRVLVRVRVRVLAVGEHLGVRVRGRAGRLLLLRRRRPALALLALRPRGLRLRAQRGGPLRLHGRRLLFSRLVLLFVFVFARRLRLILFCWLELQ